jgi:hypothetical protein
MMRGYLGTFTRIAMLCGLGLVGCGGGLEEGLFEDREYLADEGHRVDAGQMGDGGPVPDQRGLGTGANGIIAHGTVPGVPSELSGLTYANGSFFSVHRNNANGHLVITQLIVTDWARGTWKDVAQGSVPFNDPEGISYIDRQGAAWRFVAAGERGTLSIVEMNGNAVTVKANKQVGTYDNEGIEGVCYYDGYVYYGIQKDGKVYRVAFDRQKGTFGDKIEGVASAATSVRDMTVIGAGLYAISGTRLTRVAGTGSAEIRSPIALGQLEGVAYSADKRVIVVVGEPSEYAMFTY